MLYKFMIKKQYDENLPVFLTKRIPLFWNILLCHNDLKEDDIYTFCFRAVNCQINNLFIIVKPEELKISEEKYFLKIFNELLKEKKYIINSTIIVLYTEISYVIKQLQTFQEKYEFKQNMTIEKMPIDNLEDLPIEIVSSDSPRNGKTSYILSKIPKNKSIITITLGEIDRKYLISKLSKLNENNSLIIELYENHNYETKQLIRNFLFEFLILKKYEDCNYFFENINIFIKISSGYINYNEDYKILELFKKYHISQRSFYQNNKVKEKDEFINVFGYLKLLNNENINLSHINITDITDNDCESLINEYFIKNNPLKKLILVK